MSFRKVKALGLCLLGLFTLTTFFNPANLNDQGLRDLSAEKLSEKDSTDKICQTHKSETKEANKNCSR